MYVPGVVRQGCTQGGAVGWVQGRGTTQQGYLVLPGPNRWPDSPTDGQIDPTDGQIDPTDGHVAPSHAQGKLGLASQN